MFGSAESEHPRLTKVHRAVKTRKIYRFNIF